MSKKPLKPIITEEIITNLSEIYLKREEKQKELEFYTEELIKLQQRLQLISREIGVTETIIHLIEIEKIIDLGKGKHR